MINTDKTHNELVEMLGDDHFVTPCGMAKALNHTVAVLKCEIAELKSSSTMGQAKYMTQAKLARLYGISESRCMRMLRPLIAEKKIRCMLPVAENGNRGNKIFNVEDFEKAYLVKTPSPAKG